MTLIHVLHVLLVFKVLDGYSCLDLTKRQRRRLSQEGSSRRHWSSQIHAHTPPLRASLHKHFEDQAAANQAMHILRLEGTLAYRQILREVGYRLSNRPSLEFSPPLWEAPQLADAKTLPRNMGCLQKERRRGSKKCRGGTTPVPWWPTVVYPYGC